MRISRILLVALLCLRPVVGLADEVIELREMLVLERSGRLGRMAVYVDAVEAQRVAGTWTTPRAGDAVTAADGSVRTWRTARAGDDGWITGRTLTGGYACATVEVDADRVMILEASGHRLVLVNGEPRAGDPYETGYVRLPVLLKKGRNELLFHVARGRVRAKLTPAPAQPYDDPQDATLPDFILGRADEQPFGVVRINPTTQPVTGEQPIAPLSVRKIVRTIRYDGSANQLRDPRTGVSFRIRRPGESYKRTFISAIDGSVQYFAVQPATTQPAPPRPLAMVVSLHGASVEAIGQADAYAPKSWCDIVCPTNRRPFGFDWEDWGQLDLLEVLDEAKRLLQPDESRIYLTGHSMGGHGTWIVGALFPDRFAAIGPSAGWISHATYPTTRPATQPSSPLAQLLHRAASTSETPLLIGNLASLGVYILHGAEDDDVPVEQARQMVEALRPVHGDFVYHEQPGAGHWWDASDEPGADCVDWPAMFDFFARRRLPARDETRQIEFTTPSPGVSARAHWVTIEAQHRAMLPSTIRIRLDPHSRRYVGTSANVARLSIDVSPLPAGEPVEIELDGQKFAKVDWPAQRRIWLERSGETWSVTAAPSPALKGPHRCGPFKRAWTNRMIFVYSTRGTPEENAWSLAKARFDAEAWWYQGNGAADLIADVELDVHADRNVILYGNADSLSCWDALLGSSPVQLRREEVTISGRSMSGDDLACLMLRPHPHSENASVAVIGGTGLRGMRASDRLPVFLTGVGFPDAIVIGADAFARGIAGVRCAGFFGNDWSVESGQWQWRDEQQN